MGRRRHPTDRRTRGEAFRGRLGTQYGALRRHAVPDDRNQPLRCYPGLPELRGDVPTVPPQNDGKVCFPDEAAAKAAAREMHPLRPSRVYPCPRRGGTGPDGHWHHTSK